LSTILNALNKVQAERMARLRWESAERERMIKKTTARFDDANARKEIEALLNKLRNDFTHELYFLREENRMLSEKLDHAERCIMRYEYLGNHPSCQADGVEAQSPLTGPRIAERLGIRYCADLLPEVSPIVAARLPRKCIYKFRCLPLHEVEQGILVAMVDPTDTISCDAIERELSADIIPVTTEMESILRALASLDMK